MTTQLHPDETTTILGATRLASGRTQFRVWAPDRNVVEVAIDGRDRIEMRREDAGYWSAVVDSLGAGTVYGYALDRGATVLPDPVSRFQPTGPHGRSEIIDATQFQWTDAAWGGIRLQGQVLYELHVGTFTHEGTWDAARGQLSGLATLGVTAVEVMPIADFTGRFGWGYDGTCLYAPHHHYGRPDDLRRFIDTAHGLGIGVILDVVYNHVGPDGNYLPDFSPRYFSKRSTEWGAAFNYDGEDNRPVRDFIAGNAEYWIREYHFDGLRLDATQSIYDRSPEHILAELARRARAAAAGRSIVLVAENEPQDTDLVRAPARGGQGLDALWNDDFHHSAMVALLGSREAYYTDYLGRAHEFVAAMKHGYLYQGQWYAWQKKRRGRPAFDLEPRHFVAFLENHDQVANTPRGVRLRDRAQPGAHRAMTAMLLLGPWTPMLFQGQEWSSERCFAYFADFDGRLAKLVHHGRGESLKQFPSYASRAVQEGMPAPGALATFESSKLDWTRGPLTPRGLQSFALHRDLLALRRDEPVLRACIHSETRRFEATVLTDHALALRYFGSDGSDLLLIVNLGSDYDFTPAPEPLLAPPRDAAWHLLWSSEEPTYGGSGVAERWTDARGWHLPGYCAWLLKPAEAEPDKEPHEPNEQP
jgi:maltooligosyltrehalose trehalohydrolase